MGISHRGKKHLRGRIKALDKIDGFHPAVLLIPCPACRVPIGKRCIALTTHHGNEVGAEMSEPHPSRLKRAKGPR